jgi:DNA-binding NarL/FixJ family response regulator
MRLGWLLATLSVLVTGEVYLPPEEADARRKRRRLNSQMVVAPGDNDGSRSGTPPVTVWTERKLGDRQAAIRAYQDGMKVSAIAAQWHTSERNVYRWVSTFYDSGVHQRPKLGRSLKMSKAATDVLIAELIRNPRKCWPPPCIICGVQVCGGGGGGGGGG